MNKGEKMEMLPEFSYWFNRKSRVVYSVYNMSPERGKVSLSTCNGSNRNEYIINIDTLMDNYKFIGDHGEIDDALVIEFYDKRIYRQYRGAKKLMRRIKDSDFQKAYELIVDQYENKLQRKGATL